MKYQILDYDPIHNEGIKLVESSSVQGYFIKLKILKNHILDRARVFKNYKMFVAQNEKKEVVGSFTCSETKCKVNGQLFKSGVLFDGKVMQSHRNQGIGKTMAKHAYRHFFIPNELKQNYTTIKANNKIVFAISLAYNRNISIFDFLYLTIPTTEKIAKKVQQNKSQHFNVTLFDDDELDKTYYKIFPEGLSYFRTYMMYKINIEKVSSILKLIIWGLKKLKLKNSASIPSEGRILSFATLYNIDQYNIHEIEMVMQDLKNNNIEFLMVCCQKNDWIYQYFKPYSIDEYGYYIISDFPLKRSDEVTIDVRCL
jgi:hypothetical protein